MIHCVYSFVSFSVYMWEVNGRDCSDRGFARVVQMPTVACPVWRDNLFM
jgi:hypothetical protein